MNIIRLVGGLGNQFFQYALGRAQKAKGIVVKYQVSWYNKQRNPPRPYVLDKFYTNVPFGAYLRQRGIEEHGFNADIVNMDNCNFNGYWQYYAYFDAILPILREEFRVREEYYTDEYLALRECITKKPSVSVHVRRTDYLSKGWQVMPLNYYREALKYVSGDVYVFSDDIEWCKDSFEGVTFVHLADYLDFELMRLCTHNIIASSSFSWWAAYLNANPNKIVIAPVRWIVTAKSQKQGHYNNSVHYPKQWLKI